MGAHGTPIGCPCAPMKYDGMPMGGAHGPPLDVMGIHRISWDAIASHGSPWDSNGTTIGMSHGDAWAPMGSHIAAHRTPMGAHRTSHRRPSWTSHDIPWNPMGRPIGTRTIRSAINAWPQHTHILNHKSCMPQLPPDILQY